MIRYSNPTSELATIHLREMSEECARWRLATTVMRAQLATAMKRPSTARRLYELAIQLQQKLSLRAWQTIARHG
jgi:RNase P protein component